MVGTGAGVTPQTQPMPTPAERLATLEALSQRNRERIDQLQADIHSGPGVEWDQSIRGRLHAMQNAITAADKLADAAREVRRMQVEAQRKRIKTWQWTVIAAASVIGAASPYVLLFFH